MVTHMNSSGAVGDILVLTFANLSDNNVYAENRKYISSSSSSSSSSKQIPGPFFQANLMVGNVLW